MSESKRLIVAIDGPAGAGKSTVASRIASRFGLLNLETGAMYRAFALKALDNGVSPADPDALEHLAATTLIRLESSPNGNRVYLDTVEVTARLRDSAVTEAASRVSIHPAIRMWLVALQRKLGESGRIVMEGRDIGNAVFPDADVKIFLDADPEVRSQRRYEQIEAKPDRVGIAPESPSSDPALQESMRKEIHDRDQRDRTRAVSPLRPAPDAVVIDSTNSTLEEVIERVESIIEARLRLA